jgi:protoporphyrinogen oxidase
MLILGGGMSGIAAGIASGYPICEMMEAPGGICSSYYMRPGQMQRVSNLPVDGEAYRFEIGGGHWIFGGDPAILRFLGSVVPLKSYARRSSVYFRGQNLYVPYPLQYHLGYLDKRVALAALDEMATAPRGVPETMLAWLEQSFGKTLTDLFFGPFHKRYTAGLCASIAPQDAFKSPVDFSLALRGVLEKVPPVGYNVTFTYPTEGLNALSQAMAVQSHINYKKEAVEVDVAHRAVYFSDGTSASYDMLISTLPLNRMMALSALTVESETDPYTSVLVLNIGAIRGSECPDDHWLYVPEARSGFHRVGFYSNVDVSFLPASSQEDNSRVNLYVERAYQGGKKPEEEEIRAYTQAVVQELQEWGFIGQVEVLDATWIEVAYTWIRSGSKWRSEALKVLEQHGIYQVGRYGRWMFQGIGDSIRDGFYVGQALRSSLA